MQRIDSQFQNHRFSTDPLKKEAAEKKKKEEKKEAKKAAAAAAATSEGKPLVKTSKGLMIATIVLLVLISAGVVYGLYYILSAPARPRSPKKGPRDRVKRKTETAAIPCSDFERGRGGKGTLGHDFTVPGTVKSCPTSHLTAAVVADIPALVHERIVPSG
jgi:hypothetical protein